MNENETKEKNIIYVENNKRIAGDTNQVHFRLALLYSANYNNSLHEV